MLLVFIVKIAIWYAFLICIWVWQLVYITRCASIVYQIIVYQLYRIKNGHNSCDPGSLVVHRISIILLNVVFK